MLVLRQAKDCTSQGITTTKMQGTQKDIDGYVQKDCERVATNKHVKDQGTR